MLDVAALKLVAVEFDRVVAKRFTLILHRLLPRSRVNGATLLSAALFFGGSMLAIDKVQ